MESTLEIERVGFKYFSIIIGILFIVFISITCICIKEKSSVDMQTASVKQMFKALLQNDQAMTIVLTIILVNTATYITSNLLIYFFKYDLAGSNWQGNYTLFNTFAGAMQILAMMAFFPLLRKAFSSLKIFYISVGAAIVGYAILLVMALAGSKNVFLFFVPGFFIMSAVGILNVIVTIFLANTVDYGELKNKRRDESVIFSMQTFVVKLASGIAALVASICLSVFNIQSNSTGSQTGNMLIRSLGDIASGADTSLANSSVFGLRLVMTVAPVIVLVIALLVFKAKYILTDKKLEEISAELKARS
jgi:Na+/melibiose symporter-like transporter